MSLAILIPLVIVCGVFVGILSGLVGIGGGSIVIPLLSLGLGLPILNATSTSLFTVFCTSCSGAIRHIRNRTANVKLALLLAIPGLCCSPLGAILAGRMPDAVLTCITATIMLVPVVQMLRSARKQRKAKASDPAVEITWKDTHLDARTIAIAIPAGALAGFLSGMVGLGGGFLIIPVVSGLLKRGMHETTATSVCFIFISSIAGTITHALAGDVAWMYGILVALGSIPGAQLGANISKKLDGIVLKYLFAAVIIVVAVMLFIEGLA